MNKRENDLLIRISSVIRDIPLPVNGASTKSATFGGFITYGKDMAVAKPVITSALFHVRIGDFEEAEAELKALEEFIKLRNGQQWEDIFPFPTIRQ